VHTKIFDRKFINKNRTLYIKLLKFLKNLFEITRFLSQLLKKYYQNRQDILKKKGVCQTPFLITLLEPVIFRI